MSRTPTSKEICPECAQGKHINCNGVAWSEKLDGPVPCSCKHES